MPSSADRVYEILLIDDSPGDALLVKEAWAHCSLVRSHVSVLADSRAAIVYLRGALEYTDIPSPRPDLILLDYKMPVNGGIALTEIKGDPDYMMIPVIVLTGSRSPKDLADIYARGANACHIKRDDLDGLFELVRQVAEYWLLRVAPPPVPTRQPGDT
jgi:CheY-like chemotaxis protein